MWLLQLAKTQGPGDVDVGHEPITWKSELL